VKRLLKIVIVFLTFLFFCCENTPSDKIVNNEKKHTVRYTVETDISKINVTINGKIGNNEIYNGVIPPWEYSFEAEEGDYLYISAGNGVGITLGYTITVNIYKDGTLFKSNTASGVNVKAIAYGTL